MLPVLINHQLNILWGELLSPLQRWETEHREAEWFSQGHKQGLELFAHPGALAPERACPLYRDSLPYPSST